MPELLTSITGFDHGGVSKGGDEHRVLVMSFRYGFFLFVGGGIVVLTLYEKRHHRDRDTNIFYPASFHFNRSGLRLTMYMALYHPDSYVIGECIGGTEGDHRSVVQNRDGIPQAGFG